MENGGTRLRIPFAALLLTLFAHALIAAPVGKKEAMAAANGWLLGGSAFLKDAGQRTIGRATAFTAGTNGEFFVVGLKPAGFVIIPGDNDVEPLLVIAPTGTFDPSPANPLLNIARGDAAQRIARVAGNLKRGIRDAQQIAARGKWERLLAAGDGKLARADNPIEGRDPDDLRVGPLVETKWGQTSVGGEACYNYYTYPPEGTPDDPSNAPCGCVATCMGQLMRYHEFPTKPLNSIPMQNAYMEDGVITTIPWTFGGVAYAWDKMLLDPDEEDIGDEGREAIGKLMRDAGAAVGMTYSNGASWASTWKSAEVLTDANIFSYSSAARAAGGDGMPLGDLYHMINASLDARLPVLLGIDAGPNVTLGHAVVCDGYGYEDDTLYHHINLGWGGQDDAYYNLPDIPTPTGGHHFTRVTTCVFNVSPNDIREIVSGRVLDLNDTPISGAKVTATPDSGGGVEETTTDAKGIYAFTTLSSDTTYTIQVSSGGALLPNATSASINLTLLNSYDDNPDLKVGNRWGIDLVLDDSLPVRVVGDEGSGAGQFSKPRGLAVDSQHRLYVSDSGNHRIQRLDPSTGMWTVFGRLGGGLGEFNQPLGIAIDAADNLYVADAQNARIQVRAPDGTWLSWGGAGGGVGAFSGPYDVAVDSDGSVYVADHYNNRVQKRTPAGSWSVFVAPGFDNGFVRRPSAVTVDGEGSLFVADYLAGDEITRVQQFATTGGFIRVVGSSETGMGELSRPSDVACVVADDMSMASADTGNDRIVTYDGSGWTVLLGSGYTTEPEGVAHDAGRQRLYVADTGGDRILMVDLKEEGRTGVQGCELHSDASGFTISWEGLLYHLYTVSCRSDLTDGTWQELPGAVDIPSLDAPVTITDTNAPLHQRRFYRIKVH